MKLIRFGDFKQEKPGILTNGDIRKDCSGLFEDWTHDFFQNDGLEKLRNTNLADLPDIPSNVRWGACVPRPGKIVCIAGNYKAHCDESKSAVSEEPVIFMKAPNCAIGPYDNIVIPKNSAATDWEVELAVIIGKDATYLESVEEAEAHIAGYAIANDVSERVFQKEHCGQFTKGKSCDTFFPLGPFMATRDEISNVLDLSLICEVNGQVMQNSSTKSMMASPAEIVRYISQFMTLEAGDVVSTGTPAGVGMGMNPPQFLKPGDSVELTIDKLGLQKQRCVAWEAPR